MNEIDISVVIPTYNRADLLLKAVDSVLNQTYSVKEILVCDDGSDDESFELIRELRNDKIRWIACGRNGRPSIPRNVGIEESQFSWIAFLDSDDEWLPNKIEKQVELIHSVNAKAVCTNGIRIVDGVPLGKYLSYHKQVISFRELTHVNYVICSSIIVNRDWIRQVGYFNESERLKAIEDYELWLRLSAFSDIFYIEHPLVRYNDNPSISIREASRSLRETQGIVFNFFERWLAGLSSPPPFYLPSLFLNAKKVSLSYLIYDHYLKLRSLISRNIGS